MQRRVGAMASRLDIMVRLMSALARKARRPREPSVRPDGFPVFDVGDDAPPLTCEMVRNALEGI